MAKRKGEGANKCNQLTGSGVNTALLSAVTLLQINKNFFFIGFFSVKNLCVCVRKNRSKRKSISR